MNSTQQSASQAKKKKRTSSSREGIDNASEGNAHTNHELPYGSDSSGGNGAPAAKRRKSSPDDCVPIGEPLETLFGKNVLSKVLKEAGIVCTAEHFLACNRPSQYLRKSKRPYKSQGMPTNSVKTLKNF